MASEAPAAPDVPTVNGKEVQQAHIDMLLNDPSLAPKFDQFYGPNAGKQILAQYGNGAPQAQDDGMMDLMANTMGQGANQQQQREQAKAEAVDQYKAMREAASPRHTVTPKKEPSEKHVQMLRDNPSFAPKFDAVYGEGVAAQILGEDAGIKDMQDTYREGPMFPDSGQSKPMSVSPLDMSKIGGGGAGDDAENSNSPRTTKWKKENETRAAMGLKPKPHPSKKKK